MLALAIDLAWAVVVASFRAAAIDVAGAAGLSRPLGCPKCKRCPKGCAQCKNPKYKPRACRIAAVQ